MLADRFGDGSRVLPEGRQRVLLLRIHAYIDEHLDDPALAPAEIAAAHHISTRHLYKLFQAQGATVAGSIRARRLEHCRRDLALADRPVSAIEARWGFTNAAHFVRLFRETYSVPPGEFRRLWNGHEVARWRMAWTFPDLTGES